VKSEKFIAGLRQISKDKAGRIVIWGLLEHARIHQTVFDSNAQLMAFREGERNFGLWLEDCLTKVNPNLIYEIAKEINDDNDK
jgi:hypothetical protein